MGTRSEISQLLGEVRWSEDGSYLGDILKREILPLVAKVSHGSYAGSLNPGSHVLLISAGPTQSLVAQCVKFKTGRPSRASPFGPTLLIPSSYPAHFELLNEEGRSVPNLLSVQGLASLALAGLGVGINDRIKALVREPFKALLAEGDEKTYRIGAKSKNLLPGELLTVVGVVSVPSRSKQVAKYLRVMDGDGATIFLPCNPKGKFSPVSAVATGGGVGVDGGEQDGIGGVHTTRGILAKRLPLMVRLVEGRPPPNGRNFKFFPDLRLYSTLNQQLIFALPLSPSWKESLPSLVPLPISAPLKFKVGRNMDELEGMKSFTNLVHRAGCLLLQVKDRIQIYDMSLQKELPRFDGRQWTAYTPPIFLTPESAPTTTKDGTETKSNELEEECYQDIDELYDYVRGVKPSPPGSKGHAGHHPHPPSTTLVTITSSGPDVIAHVNNQNLPKPQQQRHSLPDNMLHLGEGRLSPSPPLPPPIETIPSRCNNHKKVPPLHDSSGVGHLNARNRPDSSPHQHHHHHHHHHHGTQIQIQIGSGGGEQTKVNQRGGIVITTTRSDGSGGGGKNQLLDSTGGSLSNSTTPTNTCSSSATQSSSSSSNGPSSRNKLGRTGLYIKHCSNNNGPKGDIPTGPGGGGPFRRSPMFDCRYKSLTELNNPLASPGSGGLYSGKGSLTNLNKLGLNMGHPGHPGHGGLRNSRPKSLNNIFAMDEIILYHPKPSHHHSTSNNFKIMNGNITAKPVNVIVHQGVRKRLADLVMPNHSQSKGSSSSQRSARHFRKASIQHSALFL